MNEFDAIVAGAGIWGCTMARRLAEAGRRVLVLEKRAAVGGNVRCETDPETGIEIHTYGSHIFHTHIPEVWEFVNRFVSFNGYQHKVLANYKGKVYQLPLGLNLVNKFFGVELKPEEVGAFMADETHSAAIFDAFFRGYTSKQWGRPPEAIDPSIIKRVPVRTNYDTNYFNDYWQGIPSEGYNALFDRLLDHPAITIRCNTAFQLPTSNSELPTSTSPQPFNLSTFQPSSHLQEPALAELSRLVGRGLRDFAHLFVEHREAHGRRPRALRAAARRSRRACRDKPRRRPSRTSRRSRRCQCGTTPRHLPRRPRCRFPRQTPT